MIGIGVNIVPFINKVARTVADYVVRITGDAGVSESTECANTTLSQLDSKNLFNSASLIISPSGYKGGKLYSEIPTNGNGDLTWTRGSDAFRTNASGVLQRVPWNLVQYSEQFNDASWIKGNVTATANTITAPDGNLTADTITIQTTSGNNLRQNVTVTANTTYTFSFYALRGTATDLRYSVFNFSGGSDIVAVTSYYSQTNSTTWSRITVTFTTPTGCTSIGVYPVRDVTSTGTFFIWGAQLVEGTTAQTYLPTTDRLNFPRLSYMYGSCPSVLLEPQRTNSVLYSEQFDNASWGKFNTTVTANTEMSPDGTTNADSLVESTDLVATNHQMERTSGFTSGVAYTFSIFIKPNSSRSFRIAFSSGVFGTNSAFFDLQNKTILSQTGGVASIVEYTNGYLRCIFTATATTTATGVVFFNPTDGTSRDYIGNGTLCFYLWGAQLEVGAYATTYIPTTSATATRVADSFSRNNIYTNGLITSSGGTWFVELRGNVALTPDTSGQGISLGDNITPTSGNQLQIRSLNSSSRIILSKRVAGTFTSLYTTTTNTCKIIFKWNGSTLDIFENGVKVITATSFTATALEYISTNILDAPKFIQQMAFFPTPLSDTDCELLTGTAYSSYESMATALGYYVI